MIVGYSVPRTNYMCRNTVITLSSLPPTFCSILISLASIFSPLLSISGIAQSFLSASSSAINAASVFLTSLPCWNTWGLLSYLLLFSALFLLLQCPSCKTAPGINTPFQVWSYNFPAAARQELYFQVQNCSALILDRVQRCSSSVRILILVIQEKSSCLCKHAQSPFAATTYPLHTVISICLFRL